MLILSQLLLVASSLAFASAARSRKLNALATVAALLAFAVSASAFGAVEGFLIGLLSFMALASGMVLLLPRGSVLGVLFGAISAGLGVLLFVIERTRS